MYGGVSWSAAAAAEQAAMVNATSGYGTWVTCGLVMLVRKRVGGGVLNRGVVQQPAAVQQQRLQAAAWP